METLNLPKFPFRTKTEDGKTYILDEQRKKYVKLTPEEWVRQHMVKYLIGYKGYPSQLIVNEGIVELNGMSKRFDTVIHDRQGKPQLIAEYKAPSVKITQKVFDQIASYNMKLHVDYLLVSNGLSHYCCKVNWGEDQYTFLHDIPECFF
ncbi:MAG: type I restriction enzyme HsdR N-terminal domain-containing protein [Paludibacteraceae bacterium]|jgi:hypothetical protein|nr:type I restriction enzyme HsdR N-terminal domain-containing protein [Paludibacteraceae bacterium]MBP3716023.1 type I restriction enzyme HsdR N-terminal domain-containing protein [Paludibacteraceae bacterium]MBR6105607.1 type I restriction enzyme HsdR N-terminal domain-containing protein [Paludibacteraceae bacterium]